jgi:acetyl-CoA acyltransferase
MNAYIIAGFRSAVGKAPRGKFRFTRPDDLAAHVVNHLVGSVPGLERDRIDDVIVGNATPEAEQGLNIGRMISLMGLNTDKVPGMTVNRYCSSGSETIAIAAAKIHSGQADVIVAGGVECMSPIPFGGWRIVPNAKVGKANPTYYWGMGLTAEAVARDFKVSREDQDAFSLRSHEKALAAISRRAVSPTTSCPTPWSACTWTRRRSARWRSTWWTPMKVRARAPWRRWRS